MSKIGKVKWFNGTKGFGFIAVDGDEKDIFVHISAVKDSGIDSLVEGDTIEFEVEDGNKGPVAVQLKKQ
jgi:CspA family cold shock protein|tara:strand:- start:3 stop:209 length:207 start_codon:yes stop_codon:yes gene_type:complete